MKAHEKQANAPSKTDKTDWVSKPLLRSVFVCGRQWDNEINNCYYEDDDHGDDGEYDNDNDLSFIITIIFNFIIPFIVNFIVGVVISIGYVVLLFSLNYQRSILLLLSLEF